MNNPNIFTTTQNDNHTIISIPLFQSKANQHIKIIYQFDVNIITNEDCII